MRRIAYITLSTTIPDGWVADDVVQEIKSLMELSGEEVRPEFIAARARTEWRTHE